MFDPQTLINFRKRKKFSQAQVARMMHVSQISVYNWEHGIKRPNEKNYHRLRNLFWMSDIK